MEGIITQINDGSENLVAARTVYVLRHGQTALNRQDKIRAWLDIPLDNVGVDQAIELGEAMRGVELDGLYSSDLLRTVQTSIEVSKMSGIPILGTTKSLRPWNVGDYSGQDGEKVHKIMAKYAHEMPDERLPGGESFNIFKYRILAGIIGLLNSNRGLKLGLVSHSRGERMLHAWVAAGCPEDLEVDIDVFLEKGEGTATAQELLIECPLVLT